MSSLRKRLTKRNPVANFILILLCALVFYPFVALIVMSVKDTPQFMHHPWSITFPMHFVNYAEAYRAIAGYLFNTFFVSGVSCAAVLAFSSFTAYVLARFEFPGREALYYAIISLMMVPGLLTLVPQFMLVKEMGLLNSPWALILPYIAGGQVMGIFLLRTFFMTTPKELYEAAHIDGANDFWAFFNVALPLSKPVLGIVAIMNVTGTWNDLLWPLVAISEDRYRTITIGLAFFRGEYYTQWGPLFAGYVLAAVPLIALFAFTARYFVEGMVSGALKA